ncbi:transcriptional regulator [Pontibacter virosus]|uniref:Uncharacterized protein n=1 Tax=Pontibacter virosus TaxID=1765052 RepID=A0A2U1AT90_9BACT|nr:transcriptional regulator [Pontibacter virosus]PVY39487.1 hypothetical protein C8E01_11194 [Pontibacter virosus]
MTDYKRIKTFDEVTEREHGKIGIESRNKYEENAQLFIVSEMLEETQSSKEECCDELSMAEKEAIDKGLEDADKGNVTPHEEVRKRYSKWL